MNYAAVKQNFSKYQQLDVRYDPDVHALWYYMKAGPRPCFTVNLLNEIASFQASLKTMSTGKRDNDRIDFLVLASGIPHIFNLGGDLDLFKSLIRNKDRDGLSQYATLCIDVLYQNVVNLNLPVTTIGLVKGSALGGGLEAALSCDVLIAEKGAKMGFPEILFNLFPGMGAYSLLARKLDPVRAEKLILSGKLYDAKELYDMGVVDHLADKGQGEKFVAEYIKRHNKFKNGFDGIRQVREKINPLDYQELKEITDIWVETALKLKDKDIRMMDRLVRSQDRLYQSASSSEDRRADEQHDDGNFPGVERRDSLSISMPTEKRRPYLHSVRVGSRKDKEEEKES
ncbi:MAG: crotonase/enoyl-CoA hydratase family protein [Proteobacteria bacterium]|nr:crotonase/enoyl-CoA hydratase family protein [Pseudomonadota bacterium]